MNSIRAQSDLDHNSLHGEAFGQQQVEPDAAEMAARYGTDTSVLDWRERLVRSECGGREVDFVVTGTERR